MLNLRESKKKVMNRKWLFAHLLGIIIIGLLFGFVMVRVLTFDEIKVWLDVNIPLCILLSTLFMVFMWLPLFVGDRQIYDMNDYGLQTIAKKGMFEKWRLILYILFNNNVEPFLRMIPYEDILSGEFGAKRHAGAYGFSRYTYTLKLQTREDQLTIYINPMDNGPFMPSGQGGFVLSGYKSRAEICNIIAFMETKGIPISDHYHIQDALKRDDIEIYDYLESLQIKVKY